MFKLTRLIILVLILSIISKSGFCDKLIKLDGDIIECQIINVTKHQVEYKTREYPFLIIPRDSVTKIVYDDGSMVILNKGVSQIETSSKKKFTLEPEFHIHNGFYLRGILGIGSFKSLWQTDGYNDLKLEGSNSNWILDIGGAIDWNLILFFQAGAFTSRRLNPSSSGMNLETINLDYTTTSISGFGLTYYFPTNTYVSLAYNLTTQSLAFGGTGGDMSTSTGNGLFISLGHEFWISANWGVGLSVYYHYSKIKEDGGNIKNTIYGVAISTTYN